MKRVLLLALLCAVACVPAAWAAGKTKTTVTIDAVFLASGQTHWSGDMKSARKACKDRRRVLIYRQRPGADVKVGSTKSFKGMVDNGYYWTYFDVGAAPSGKYYAKVKPTDRCQGDHSGTLEGP
jgi:hypothetical protein